MTFGLCASLTAAQETQRPQDAWLERAQNLTNDSLKDVKSLETLDGALVLAQLGTQWLTLDPNRARKWLNTAVETTEYRPPKETSEERNKRLSVTRSLLTLIPTADQKLAERLQAALAVGDGTVTEAERATNANALVYFALVVLKTDPIRAASIGSAVLRVGRPPIFHNLLIDLRLRDPSLADSLFSEALSKAEESFDEEFLNSLRYAAFPELYGPEQNVAWVPPDGIRREMLRILAAYLQQRTAVLASKGIRDCGLAPALVERLQIHFDRLQPQRADLVRQIVRNCQESITQSVADSGSNAESVGVPETVDNLLWQADQTTDKKVKRPHYLALAARLAASQKHFELAIKILESMNDEERKFTGMWETWRRDWAEALAIEYMKRDDIYGMRQVIKAVPDELRPFAKINLADKLLRGSSIEIARDLLDESRKDLANSEKMDLEKVYWYLLVTRLYARCQADDEAVEAFKDAIRSLGRARGAATSERGDLSELIKKIIQPDFPAILLESYDYTIRDVVSSMTSVPKRVRVRLDLLEISIKEYRTLAARFTLKKRAPYRKPK
jgi:hypothetical protein